MAVDVQAWERPPEPESLQPPVREVADASPQPMLIPPKARHRGEPRSPVTTRLTHSIQDRLFRASLTLGKPQQAIIEEALEAYLRKNKF